MMTVTDYVVQHYGVGADGELHPKLQVHVRDRNEVRRLCEALEHVEGGAWGFAWPRDPVTGRRGFKEMIARHGRVARELIPVIGAAR